MGDVDNTKKAVSELSDEGKSTVLRVLPPPASVTVMPKVPMPQRKLFTRDRLDEILKIRATGIDKKTVAKRARISPRTLDNWLAAGENISDEATGYEAKVRQFYLDFHEAYANATLRPHLTFYKAATTGDDWHAALEFLRVLRPDIYLKRTQVTGPDGGPIRLDARVMQVLTQLPIEDLDTLEQIAIKTKEVSGGSDD